MMKKSTAALSVLLAGFAVLNASGIQPGEDHNVWLLYTFVLVWPALSIAVLVAALRAEGRNAWFFVSVAVAFVSLVGFAVWAKAYAGLW
jgi:hypothetical protein